MVVFLCRSGWASMRGAAPRESCLFLKAATTISRYTESTPGHCPSPLTLLKVFHEVSFIGCLSVMFRPFDGSILAQVAIAFFLHHPVTLAGDSLQARPVENLDAPAAVVNQIVFLKNAGRLT